MKAYLILISILTLMLSAIYIHAQEKMGNVRIDRIECDADRFEYVVEIETEGSVDHGFDVEVEIDGNLERRERMDSSGILRIGAMDGEHTVKVRVDAGNEIEEWDEGDNERESRVYCEAKKPDFYVESIEYDEKKSRYRIRIGNSGDAEGKPELRVEIDGEPVGYEAEKEKLAPGEVLEIYVDARDGEHEIRVKVDPDSRIEEKDEGNNERAERIKAIVFSNPWTLVLRPGWNFIAPFMFMNEDRIKSDCGNMEEFGILMWMPDRKRFMSIYDVMVEVMMKTGGDEKKAKSAIMQTILKSGLWVYSEKTCSITSEAKRMPPGFTMDMDPGWNILPLMGNVSGLSVADISGNCDILAMYKWNSLNQSWVKLDEDYVFTDADTFLALAVKVRGFCKIGRMLRPPGFPEG